MLVSPISRWIQSKRRTVMTLHHRQRMTRTRSAWSPMMKAHPAIIRAPLPPNATNRKLDFRPLPLAKNVRDI